MDRTRWTRYVIIFLGLWMIAAPMTFDHHSFAMTMSDTVCGFLLLFLGAYALISSRRWVLWAVALVGVWMNFAPIVFWAPEAFSYINDTIVGVLAIAMSILIPVNPLEDQLEGSPVPPGWTYNPSTWLQRIPIVLFGFFAWMFARYMAAYQLGYLDSVWDPIFGDGTKRVITSSISHDFPVPDAGLGAMAYTIEVLMGCHGRSQRWHTIPWFVILFAILVIPLGFTSIVLIILQPIIVGAWCTWCLLTAVCMLIMIALAVDEVVAVLQFISAQRKKGVPLKEVLWKGGQNEGIQADSPGAPFHKMTQGVSIPWNLVITAILGGWLMFSPHLLKVTGGAADNSHIVGSLTVALSIICFAEVIRAGRFIVTALGVWIIISSWVLPGMNMEGIISQCFLGTALILLTIFRGKVKEKYGSWDRYII